jgi:hypothetical protein
MSRDSITLGALAILLSALFIGGCARDDRQRTVAVPAPAAATLPPAPPSAPISAADLKARYQAALSITSPTERDIALAQVAQLAARSDDVTTARSALDAMAGATVHDDAVDSVAVTLATRGRRDQATAIAQSMVSSTRRDATLAKLSTR